VTMLWGWALQPLGMSPRLRQRLCLGAGRRNHSACLCNSASDPAWGLDAVIYLAHLRDSARDLDQGQGAANYPTRLHDSASNPARGLGATIYSACFRVSASDPARGLDVVTLVKVNGLQSDK